MKKKKTAKIFVVSTVLLMIAAVVLLNVVLSLVEQRQNLKLDFSKEKYFTLSQQSLDVIDALSGEVDIYTLYATGNEDENIAGLLSSYGAASEKIFVQNIDPNLNPAFVQQYDPEGKGIGTGSVIVSRRGATNYKVLSVYDLYWIDTASAIPIAIQAEQRITSILNYFETGQIPSIKLLAGHNETSMDELADLLTSLKALNYDISAYEPSISNDILDPQFDTLMVISPKEDLNEAEYEKIKAFLDAGGNAVFMIDSVVLDENTNTNYIVADPLERFRSLLMLYDITVNQDLIVGGDPNKVVGKVTALIPEMYPHIITDSIIQSGRTPVLTDVSSITLTGDNTISGPLLQTDANTWAKEISKAVEIAQKPEDPTGPFIIAAIAQRDASKIAVYGTSSFVTATEIQRSANRSLIVNTIASLQEQGTGISIAPKSLLPGMMELQNNTQQNILIALVLVVLPLAVIVIGIVVWVKRKRL